MTAGTSSSALVRDAKPALTRPSRMILLSMRDATSIAHEQMLTARRPPHDRAAFEAARLAYLSSLTAYEGALSQLTLPLPPRLRDDLRLLRRLAVHGMPR